MNNTAERKETKKNQKKKTHYSSSKNIKCIINYNLVGFVTLYFVFDHLRRSRRFARSVKSFLLIRLGKRRKLHLGKGIGIRPMNMYV